MPRRGAKKSGGRGEQTHRTATPLSSLSNFHGIIDALRLRRKTYFFIVIGSNAIVIHIAPHFVDFAYRAHASFGGVVKRSDSLEPVALRV